MIESLEPRFSPARLFAGPVPDLFGVDLTKLPLPEYVLSSVQNVHAADGGGLVKLGAGTLQLTNPVSLPPLESNLLSGTLSLGGSSFGSGFVTQPASDVTLSTEVANLSLGGGNLSFGGISGGTLSITRPVSLSGTVEFSVEAPTLNYWFDPGVLGVSMEPLSYTLARDIYLASVGRLTVLTSGSTLSVSGGELQIG
jgi:hypothetical protein